MAVREPSEHRRPKPSRSPPLASLAPKAPTAKSFSWPASSTLVGVSPAARCPAAFCRRRWGGPATRAEFEEVSAKWLEITVATMECALLKQCEWAGGAKAVADHERAGDGLSSYVL